MIYIDFSENMNDVFSEEWKRIPKFIKKIIFKLRRKRGALYIKKYVDKTKIIITSKNKKALNKLKKYMNIECIKRVCLSKELLLDNEFLDFIRGQDVKICDGKWIYRYFIIPIIENIVQCKKEKIEYQEISILTKDVDEVLLEIIKELASKVRILNILTEQEGKFKKIEKDFFKQNGILLNINNNYKKSLLKSDIIINIDYNEEEFNKYTLPKKACIITQVEHIKINSKAFEGVFITGLEISLPRKYIKYAINFKNFDNTILYESFVYKRTTYKNIKKEIQEDNVSIISLIGRNGKIRKGEFKNLSKNKNIL